MKKGKLITFEGAEGSGKSTQSRLALEYLTACQQPVLHIREPGGVAISEAIRNILLDVKNVGMSKPCEAMLYMAARAQLVAEVIAPAIKNGKIILCDRFMDSTIAYQGYGNGTPIPELKAIGRFATQGIVPQLTFVFDINARVGLERRGKNRDRIEQRALVYHERVRRGYLSLARKEPGRIKVIRVAQKTPEEIHAQVRKYIDKLL